MPRFHEAKVNKAPSVASWGSGTPKRDFVYVDDMAAASVHAMNLDKLIYDQHVLPMLRHINVGCGQDIASAKSPDASVKPSATQAKSVSIPANPTARRVS